MASSSKIRVIVVGAGVVGCSLAMHLARAGTNVEVLDKGDICAGMSARSGALVRMHYTFAPEAALALASLRYFHNWREVVGGECGFIETGFATIVDEHNVEAVRANVAMLRGLGVDTDIIAPEELHRIDPHVNLDGVATAAYEPHSGYADPVATTHALAEAARRAGARFHLRTPVASIRTRAARAIGAMDAAGRFHEADALCLVTGPWTAPLLAPLGAQVPITPERAQIAFFGRGPRLRHLSYIDTIAGSYFRPHGDNLTLVGLGGAKLDDADPDRFREANDAEFIADVRRRLGARIGALADVPYARGHAGIYDVTPDQRPVLDEVPGIAGLYVAAGFSGTGFKTSPAVGAAMADMIMSGTTTNTVILNEVKDLRAAISSFSYTRFMTGKLIAGEHEYRMGADFGHTL
jgi:sarcosine oxidase subunit beta